jgi:hypothetical protein
VQHFKASIIYRIRPEIAGEMLDWYIFHQSPLHAHPLLVMKGFVLRQTEDVWMQHFTILTLSLHYNFNTIFILLCCYLTTEGHLFYYLWSTSHITLYICCSLWMLLKKSCPATGLNRPMGDPVG